MIPVAFVIYRCIRPLLFWFDSEEVHELTKALALYIQSRPRILKVLGAVCRFERDALKQQIWGVDFPNPIGLAAGFDKDAELLPFWKALGFGFVEVGSVTAKASDGNSEPRLFRLPRDKAIINRCGLPSRGAEQVAQHLEQFGGIVVKGVSIAKTHDPKIVREAAIEDYKKSFVQLAPFGDYVVLNVSCPNTEDGKTFEEAASLDRLLDAITSERSLRELRVPILIKLSPLDTSKVIYDSGLEEVLRVALRYRVDGFIVCNTATDRVGLETGDVQLTAIGEGGLSGRPLRDRAVRMVQYIYQNTKGEAPIIGTGGVDSAKDAYRMICAGASLVQLYTGLVYKGPSAINKIKRGLVKLMKTDGWTSVQDAVGSKCGDFRADWS